MPCWWVLTRTKQLSMAATAGVIPLCAWVRYWPYRGVGSVCFSTVHNCGNECYAALINDHFKTSFGLILNDFFSCWKFRFAFDARLNDLQFLVLELIPFAFLFFWWRTDNTTIFAKSNKSHPFPSISPPFLLSFPSNVFEINNHAGERGLKEDLRYIKETTLPVVYKEQKGEFDEICH